MIDSLKVENGKYEIVLEDDYAVNIYRCGESWIEEAQAPKMLIALIYEVQKLREDLAIEKKSHNYHCKESQRKNDVIHKPIKITGDFSWLEINDHDVVSGLEVPYHRLPKPEEMHSEYYDDGRNTLEIGLDKLFVNGVNVMGDNMDLKKILES